MFDEIDNRLRLLELKCRRPVEHLLAGAFRSVFRGRGVEFEDVRPYYPGDDVRTMDWKVTARTGEPHIKRGIEEREQCIYLLVDLSASMRHGEECAKRQTVAELGTLLILAALKNQDRVALILFTDQVELVLQPGRGRSHALRIMDALVHFEPAGRGTDLAKVLDTFERMARKHAVAFIISDFFVEANRSQLQALACKHDLNAIRINDASARSRLPRGLLRMQDAENDTQRVVDLDVKSGANDGERGALLREQMVDGGASYLSLDAGGDCVEALAGFFLERQQRASG
ncbi:MAG: DUF58 domain-containing protein [Puniceicoccaceae bacterium]|nr:MAG: DUF58 domain-containing protein [Puniceicoccaceae bacterium]